MTKIKVGINGYGTIGKRVADAVQLQDDMGVVGVSKTRPTWEARLAADKNLALYTDNSDSFSNAGLTVAGSIKDLVEQSDVVVDCTPKKFGAENKENLYLPSKTKAIFHGGEKAGVAEASFSALSNYSDSIGKDYVRVVSCNTTGLSTTLAPLHKKNILGKVRATMIRRSADPSDIKSGPINAIVPVIKVPSHHGPDVQTVLPDLNIITTAVKVPTTLMHMHCIMAELKDSVSTEDVLNLWRQTPRIHFVRADQGVTSTAGVVEFARDLGRHRYDMYETIVWEDSVNVKDNELYYFQAVHQEAIVAPPTIDCIRAMFSLEADPLKSVEKTDKSLGILERR